MFKDDEAGIPRLFHLRRRYLPRNRGLRGIIDPASWINVVLMVLFFFVIESGFVLQPGIVMELPRAPLVDGARYGSLVITMSGEDMIFFNDERHSLASLGPALAAAAVGEPDKTLVIEADKRVTQSRLVDVYNLAVEAGIERVVLATRIASAPRG